MIEPRLKTILQATLCITYAWFVGLPTISVIYEQGYSLTLGVTKIFVNHQIISVTQTMLQKSDKLMPEEAGILAMIHNPLLRETEEFNAFLDTFEAQNQEMQATRQTMKETIAKAETELQEFYSNFLTRLWLIITHCSFLSLEMFILLDKGRKLVKYLIFSIIFFPFASYTRQALYEVQALELQGADHKTITDMLLDKYPYPNGMELSNYHLYILLYIGFDAIQNFYSWTLGTDHFDLKNSR